MLIVMQKYASESAINEVIALIRCRGLKEHISRGDERTIIGAVGDERVLQLYEIERLEGVEKAIRVLNDWCLVSREVHPENSTITVRGVVFGGDKILNIAVSPKLNSDFDAVYMDSFYRPNQPYAKIEYASEKEQVDLMRQEIRQYHQQAKPVLVRIRDVRQIELALSAEADVLYLGGELMTNRVLQDEVGRLNVPLVLCKDKHHRVNDWLVAAEHIAIQGNHHIILGEAGTLSFDSEYAYRLDVDAIARVRKVSHLPVIANISRLWHGDMAQNVLYRLAVAAGANGVIHYV